MPSARKASLPARLADERVKAADFDFGYLRFKLGPAGQRALDRLKALESHPEIDLIREQIALTESAKNYWEWRGLQRGEQPPRPAAPGE